MRKIEPIASSVPYMVVAGNHEIWFNFSAYKTRFVRWRRSFVASRFGSRHDGGARVLR
jgi:hypothetical protein